MPSKKSGRKKKEKGSVTTTQRVDMETLTRIKKISFHLAKQGIIISQSDVIKYALMFAVKDEADFLEFVIRAEQKSPKGALNTVVQATGKPWFPYGNLI